MSANHELTRKNEVQTFGFWLYLLSDVMLFSALFTTFMILRGNTANGPSGSELFDPSYALLQTIALLTSSFTMAMAVLALRHGKMKQAWRYMVATGVLGLVFLGMELYEFSSILSDGYSWQSSAFLTGFFALVGTHGLHITIGLIWMAVLLVVWRKRGVSEGLQRKIGLFSLFWHFLDLVWIWIFTIVYLFGVGL